MSFVKFFVVLRPLLRPNASPSAMKAKAEEEQVSSDEDEDELYYKKDDPDYLRRNKNRKVEQKKN